MVVLTSFHNARHYHGTKYSISLYQPKGFNFPALDFFAPVSEDFNDIRTGRFLNPSDPHDYYVGLSDFETSLMEAFRSRGDEIRHFTATLDPQSDIVLCCWCPHSRSSREQVKKLGVFACHSGLVGKIILDYRPDIEVRLDNDRADRLVPQWSYGYGAQRDLFWEVE